MFTNVAKHRVFTKGVRRSERQMRHLSELRIQFDELNWKNYTALHSIFQCSLTHIDQFNKNHDVQCARAGQAPCIWYQQPILRQYLFPRFPRLDLCRRQKHRVL